MAFQEVAKGKFKKLTELAIGESLTGYITGMGPSKGLEGAFNIDMNIDGEQFSVSAAGNVKYMVKDETLTVGVLTRITRQDDTKVKGKVATRFKVEQDKESRLEGFTVPVAAAKTSMSDKLAALKG